MLEVIVAAILWYGLGNYFFPFIYSCTAYWFARRYSWVLGNRHLEEYRVSHSWSPFFYIYVHPVIFLQGRILALSCMSPIWSGRNSDDEIGYVYEHEVGISILCLYWVEYLYQCFFYYY